MGDVATRHWLGGCLGAFFSNRSLAYVASDRASADVAAKLERSQGAGQVQQKSTFTQTNR